MNTDPDNEAVIWPKDNWPPGWAPDADVAAVIAEIEKRVDRLMQIDAKPGLRKERQFLYAHINQLIKTGHS